MKQAHCIGSFITSLVLTACADWVPPAAPTVVPPGVPAPMVSADPPGYVLFDGGTFTLQYSSAAEPFFEFRGTYAEANDEIDFLWEDVAWYSTGSLNENELSVRYGDRMAHSDFIDGVFVRVP